ncbi:MAG: hypothetical protein KAV87_56220 [Desulfobacteraceae bacterium]|nr:hypothetical protein [Desulfobacteraceae bacterium]
MKAFRRTTISVLVLILVINNPILACCYVKGYTTTGSYPSCDCYNYPILVSFYEGYCTGYDYPVVTYEICKEAASGEEGWTECKTKNESIGTWYNCGPVDDYLACVVALVAVGGACATCAVAVEAGAAPVAVPACILCAAAVGAEILACRYCSFYDCEPDTDNPHDMTRNVFDGFAGESCTG